MLCIGFVWGSTTPFRIQNGRSLMPGQPKPHSHFVKVAPSSKHWAFLGSCAACFNQCTVCFSTIPLISIVNKRQTVPEQVHEILHCSGSVNLSNKKKTQALKCCSFYHGILRDFFLHRSISRLSSYLPMLHLAWHQEHL